MDIGLCIREKMNGPRRALQRVFHSIEAPTYSSRRAMKYYRSSTDLLRKHLTPGSPVECHHHQGAPSCHPPSAVRPGRNASFRAVPGPMWRLARAWGCWRYVWKRLLFSRRCAASARTGERSSVHCQGMRHRWRCEPFGLA